MGKSNRGSTVVPSRCRILEGPGERLAERMCVAADEDSGLGSEQSVDVADNSRQHSPLVVVEYKPKLEDIAEANFLRNLRDIESSAVKEKERLCDTQPRLWPSAFLSNQQVLQRNENSMKCGHAAKRRRANPPPDEDANPPIVAETCEAIKRELSQPREFLLTNQAAERFEQNSAASVSHKRVARPSGVSSARTKDGSVELKIVAQPEEQHRARYQTEGSRGAVKARAGDGFPVVQLIGYNNPTTLKVYIGTDQGKVAPHMFYHACKIFGKNSNPCREVVSGGTTIIEIDFSPSMDMTISCDCVGILKQRNVDVELRFPNENINKLKKRSTKCRMVFRVDIPAGANGEMETLQVVSLPISCTQPPGTPEISKMSLQECAAVGGKELFVIGKNFLKGTRVLFQQTGDSGHVVWQCSVLPDKEYLQPTHLICTVPPYQYPDLSEAVTVSVMVVSGGKTSEAQEFKYLAPAVPSAFASLTSSMPLPKGVSLSALEINKQFAETGRVNVDDPVTPGKNQLNYTRLSHQDDQEAMDLQRGYLQELSCPLTSTPVPSDDSAMSCEMSNASFTDRDLTTSLPEFEKMPVTSDASNMMAATEMKLDAARLIDALSPDVEESILGPASLVQPTSNVTCPLTPEKIITSAVSQPDHSFGVMSLARSTLDLLPTFTQTSAFLPEIKVAPPLTSAGNTSTPLDIPMSQKTSFLSEFPPAAVTTPPQLSPCVSTVSAHSSPDGACTSSAYVTPAAMPRVYLISRTASGVSVSLASMTTPTMMSASQANMTAPIMSDTQNSLSASQENLIVPSLSGSQVSMAAPMLSASQANLTVPTLPVSLASRVVAPNSLPSQTSLTASLFCGTEASSAAPMSSVLQTAPVTASSIPVSRKSLAAPVQPLTQESVTMTRVPSAAFESVGVPVTDTAPHVPKVNPDATTVIMPEEVLKYIAARQQSGRPLPASSQTIVASGSQVHHPPPLELITTQDTSSTKMVWCDSASHSSTQARVVAPPSNDQDTHIDVNKVKTLISLMSDQKLVTAFLNSLTSLKGQLANPQSGTGTSESSQSLMSRHMLETTQQQTRLTASPHLAELTDLIQPSAGSLKPTLEMPICSNLSQMSASDLVRFINPSVFEGV